MVNLSVSLSLFRKVSRSTITSCVSGSFLNPVGTGSSSNSWAHLSPSWVKDAKTKPVRHAGSSSLQKQFKYTFLPQHVTKHTHTERRKNKLFNDMKFISWQAEKDNKVVVTKSRKMCETGSKSAPSPVFGVPSGNQCLSWCQVSFCTLCISSVGCSCWGDGEGKMSHCCAALDL